MNECQLISLKEAADALGIHRNTAAKLVKELRFPVPTVMVGDRVKINREVLDTFIRSGSTPD